jgi:hypothetical protein
VDGSFAGPGGGRPPSAGGEDTDVARLAEAAFRLGGLRRLAGRQHAARPAGVALVSVAGQVVTEPEERLQLARAYVLGVFPNPSALLRLAGAVRVAVADDWQVSDALPVRGSRGPAQCPSRPDQQEVPPEILPA